MVIWWSPRTEQGSLALAARRRRRPLAPRRGGFSSSSGYGVWRFGHGLLTNHKCWVSFRGPRLCHLPVARIPVGTKLTRFMISVSLKKGWNLTVLYVTIRSSFQIKWHHWNCRYKAVENIYVLCYRPHVLVSTSLSMAATTKERWHQHNISSNVKTIEKSI
jgi:hypothetical protein